ncbi:hypothetical protein [Nevskia sp.]|uniref:alpha/beta hydrolase family protein n=1 Tax=Nevskia sp. TaxID=1929292 RepID=UPI0025F1E146|nr:hypothetical protein [Nevskia sp.]
MKMFQSLPLLLGALLPLAADAIPEGPAYPSLAWRLRETANYAKTLEAPTEQATNPRFVARLGTQSALNELQYLLRGLADPSWLSRSSGNNNLTPLCASYIGPCAGDPFRYPGVDPFYDEEAEVTPVVFQDRGCARISGRVWKPRGLAPGTRLPGVVIETGSLQASEPLYWWMAQALVRSGYAVMTFDVRGQGRSDAQTPSGEAGSNNNPPVFWLGLVDAIDFFRSSVAVPYPHNLACAGLYPTEVTAANPITDVIDASRLGLAGHSLGGTGVSVVQAYGAPGADAWPGVLDAENPVDVIVAWDSLAVGPASNGRPAIVPRVPAMDQSSEYGIFGLTFARPPEPDGHLVAFNAWRAAGLPVTTLTIRGSTHFEWSLIPTFPATSWCPRTAGGACSGGWGRPMAEHYSLAWLDRWLKLPGEAGFDSADSRLLADADWRERTSFYFRSARSFVTRDGVAQTCGDVRAGC